MLLLQAQAASAAPAPSPADAAPGIVLDLQIRGPIGPATSNYIVKGIARAGERNMRLVVLEMDTPGGLDSSMRDIIRAILASNVPVATFVSPSGSRAASAGTYILYASHVAAMAPATNLGAATPVQIGGGSEPEPTSAPEPGAGGKKTGSRKSDKAPIPVPGSTLERKAVNDAVAYIRGLASLRGRNADWAERAVREAVSLSAQQAVEQHVADLIAADTESLLKSIDGREVAVSSGKIRLATAGLAIERYDPDWRTQFLATITDPNIAYFLLLVGIYGLLLEGYNPGVMAPGVVGAISLLIALFAFQVLSVNYAGLALIFLGVILMVAESFVPSFGSLGLGGIAAFIIGSIILLDSDIPGFAISRSLIGGVALVAGAGVLTMTGMLVRIRRRPTVIGRESLIGMKAVALESFERAGTVFVHGERWNARASRPVTKGDELRVTGIEGLVLDVEPMDRTH